MKSKKLLFGKKKMCEFLEISEPMLDKMIKLGLPVGVINNRLFSHSDVLERFYERMAEKKININLTDHVTED